MLHGILLQFTKFPGAESIHLLQGVVAGWLLVSAVIDESLARATAALVILLGFCAYELAEMWRVSDNGDLDIQVFLIAMWLSAMVSLVVYGVRYLLNRRGGGKI